MKCRFCGDPIRWETNDYTGRPVPLNALPDPTNGDYQTIPGGGCLKLGVTGRLHHQMNGGLLYTRHNCAARKKALARS